MRKSLFALLLVLGAAASSAIPVLAAIENEGTGEGLKLVNAQMVRELTTRAARLGTSTGTSDTTFVGYTPGFKGANNYWSIYSGFGKDGYKRLTNGVPHKGTWDWEEPVNGDSLQGWWPLINQYASTGGLTLSDRVRPWWAIDYGNMANYVINQNNGRTYGVIGVWHRDGGTNQPAPAGLITPAFTPPSGNFAAWMGLRAHGDNSVTDGKTGNPFNEDLLQYVGFTSLSSTGNDYGFPGYGSQMDQMLYRDINFQGKKTANLTIHFKFNTRMSTGSGTNPVTETGWFDCDPLAFTGGATNPQLNNFISATDAGQALSPRDSFMVYIGAGVDTNLWLGSDGVLRPVYDKQRRWFGEVLHWDRDPNSSPSNPQPKFYKELLSVGGNWPKDSATKVNVGYVDTTFVIPNAALQPYLAKNNKIRLVFRVKTNRFFDDMLPSYSSNNKGAAIVDQVSYQLGSNPVVVFGDFENPNDINNDPDVGAVDAWKSTGKPPSIYHHVHLFSDLIYEDLCGAKGDISRICNMSGVVVSAGDHDNSEAAGGLVDGTAYRERNDGIMSPTLNLSGPFTGPGGRNPIGLLDSNGSTDVPGDVNPSEDFYAQYDLYAGIMDPFTKGNLWRFAFMSYPGPAKAAKGSYPAWGQMRFPGFIIFNPDKQCFEDFEGAYQNTLIKTTGAGSIPDSIKMFLGKTQQCFRFGVSTGCAPTDGCYWDNVCFAIIDGVAAQLGVDIWQWIQDAFPANETAGLPGTANFDTAAAIIKTGINVAQSTNTNLRFDVPGDSTIILSSPNTSRVDMVFRILPGPGNYNPVGRPDLGTIKRIPQNAATVTKGDGSFWDQYRQTPGDFASPNAVTLHHNAVGGWDPNVWNSARCDTQETNLASLQPTAAGGPADPSVWMSTYHESDPHFNTLGILKNKCYIRCTTCNTTDRRCDGGQPDDYTVTTGPGGTAGTTTTKEFTKIIPDGLLTPGSHVEYFFRDQKDNKAPGPMDGMIPDTNRVTQVTEGSTDGHRWQEFGVLPDRWKVQTNRHPVTGEFGRGPACLLVIDNNDRRGNERVWKAASDTIGATPQRYWGAHDGYHAVGDGASVNAEASNRRGKDGGVGWVSEHLGQAGAGSSWDMYQVKASESLTTSAGSPGSRLANKTGTAAQQIVIDKSSRQGPTPAMLNAYYVMIMFLSGDLNSGVMGPFKNRSQNDAGLIINWLQAGSTSVQNRGFWALGDGFAESNIFTASKLAPFDLMISYLGVDCFDPNYTFASGDTRDLADYRLKPQWQNKPAGQVEIFGMRNVCLFTNDVLKVEGAGLPTLGSVTSEYYGPGGAFTAGVFKDWAPSSPWKTLVDGWDIEHLTGVHDVNTRDRNGYFYKIFVNIWTKLCRVYGTPIIPLEVPTMSDGGVVDFVNLRNNPVVSGSATIHLGLARADRVEVKIFDVSGRLIRTLADRPFPAGEHDLVWDGVDNAGRQVARGVYFTRVTYQNVKFQSRNKLTVLK